MSMTPEEWANTVGMFWLRLEQPELVRALPDWEKNWQAIVEAIRGAVAEEREICAKTAEVKCQAWTEEGDGESVSASQRLYGMADAGREIAAAIRARGS